MVSEFLFLTSTNAGTGTFHRSHTNFTDRAVVQTPQRCQRLLQPGCGESYREPHWGRVLRAGITGFGGNPECDKVGSLCTILFITDESMGHFDLPKTCAPKAVISSS